MATKHDKLYSKSPKLERGEDGDMKVKKADEPVKEGTEKTEGADGSQAEDDGEVKSMHKRHEDEHKALHESHQKALEDMHGRHHKDMKELHSRQQAKTGSEEITKTEGTE